MDVRSIVGGVVFFFSWFLAGGAVATWTIDQFVMASIGGVFTPPVIWSLARDLGVTVLPILLVFGGAPAAIQIMRVRSWKRFAVVAFAICAVSWLVLMALVIWGPSIWGWSW